MTTSKTRKFFLKAGALLAAASLAFTASPAMAQEDPAVNAMPETSNIIITKVEQGAAAGVESNGTEQDPAGDRIEGVEFEAYSVPLEKTAGTEEWQQEIAGFDLEAAKTKIGNDPTPVAGPTKTDSNGVVEFKDLARGLYLIRETNTPAGVVAANDFLVAVPQTNPEGTAWLSNIYVYPKNDVVSATKTVENADDFVTGNVVTWTINADNPQVRNHLDGKFEPITKFEIRDTLIDAELSTTEADVNVTAPAGLVKGTDYKVTVAPAAEGETLVTITFEESGRVKLAAALPDADQVVVTLDTVVHKSGVIDNTAVIDHGGDSVYNTDEGGKPEIRYGDITVIKKDEKGTLLPGAEFRVYLTEESAKAKGDGYLTTESNTNGLWITGENGEVKIAGLRDSNFANGKTTDEEQKYWLVETKAPAGHQLLAQPVSFTVNGEDLTLTLDVTNASNSGNGFQLPLTGGTGTAMLTILGIAILGLVLFFARMRRNNESA
ncbi:surface protein [Corynebacterium suranareeae]|uniref:Surface protein n=1 Tax=Corynebacterium suranareeae TaxID=2506452 RepID=A0A160PUT1_9CORY|nr:SpaH/EbpB family LPXTG-anchored major pilin [Corynebacterium suranareeae]BAU96911.1 surface protein [Corynebacterium suranareeae]